MANWLGNPEHVYGDHPPTLDAGNLGSLVSAILSNRLGERALTQRTLSEAIKAEQARRQQDAYAEALRNTGLSEGQDLSGLSDSDSTRIAQLLQQRTPDTVEDNYKKALTADANARAQSYGGGGGGENADVMNIDQEQYPPFKTDPATNIVTYRHIQRGPHGQLIVNYSPVSTPIQPTTAQNQSQRQSYQTEKDLQDAITMHDLRSKIEAQQNTTANKPNTPYSQSADWAIKQKELEDLRNRRLNPPPDDQSGRQQTTMPPQRFGSEQEARQAGHQAGETVFILDPATKQYRPAVLE